MLNDLCGQIFIGAEGEMGESFTFDMARLKAFVDIWLARVQWGWE